jgi:hypothetical protein
MGAQNHAMHSLTHLLASVLRGALKLALLLFAGVMVASILLIGLSAALLALIVALFTGRKPSAWNTFLRFRQTSQRFRAGVGPAPSAESGRSARNVSDDVVDVQAREVRSALDDQR